MEHSAFMKYENIPQPSPGLEDAYLSPLPHIDGIAIESLLMDATCDVADFNKPIFPERPYGPPQRKSFPGDFDFQVEINGAHTNKKKYLYSTKLNRIYVNMGTSFSMQFRWTTTDTSLPSRLYVRSTVVFSDAAQAEKRVERCTQHTHDKNADKEDPKMLRNVLHSSREPNTEGVHYCGDPSRADSWYSVLVEFKSTNLGPFAHAYQFVCKNSCCSGINRRATEIIFELEDDWGRVHGRQVVGARSCSCPRRDMLHDEEREPAPAGKRRANNTSNNSNNNNTGNNTSHADPAPLAKRLKREHPAEEGTVVLPQLPVTNERVAVAGLGAMVAIMEHDLTLIGDDSSARDTHEKCISELKSIIAIFNSKPPAQ